MTRLIPLPPSIEASYLDLMDEVRKAQAAGDQTAYGALLLKAWDLIPEPKLKHDRIQETVGAIVAFYGEIGRHSEAEEWLGILRDAYGGGPNPHVNFVAATVFLAAAKFDPAFALFDELHANYGKLHFKARTQSICNSTWHARKGGRRRASPSNGTS